jgi:hypothetical protein
MRAPFSSPAEHLSSPCNAQLREMH